MIWQINFSPDGRLLASASSDQTVRLWDVPKRSLVRRLVGHTSEVWSLAFSPDGQRLFSGSKDLTISVWPTTFAVDRASAPVANTSLSPPLFSPNGKWLAAAAGPGEEVRDVVVRNTASLEEHASLKGERQALWFSANGSELLTLNTNAELHLWNLSPLNLRRSLALPGVQNQVSRAAASPDGRRVAFVRKDRPGIALVGVQTGELEAELPSATSVGEGLVFSPDSHFLARCSGRTIEIWDAQQWRVAVRINAHLNNVSCLAFSPDMRFMVSTSVDNTAKLWRVENWAEVATFSGHREGVMCGSFSPDGKTFATGCADGTVKLWHVGTHREMASFKPLSLAWFVAFSPDGDSLACAPGWGPLQLLRAPALEEIDARDNGGGTPPLSR
jgi:WD40 repeat protein